MKKLIISAMLCVFSLVLGSGSSFAESNYSFGVVDMNIVLEKAEAYKSITKQLDEKREVYKKEIESKEKELSAEEKEIVEQKDSLSKNDFEKKRQDFKKDMIEGHKLVQKNKAILDRAFALAMTELKIEIAKIITNIAKEKKYAAVLTQNAVMMSEPELDITNIVLEKLNAKIKTVKVDWTKANEAVTK